MYKKVLALTALLALSSCQSGAVSTEATILTGEIEGCLQEAVAQKGGSVVIKNQAQYSNLNREINALGEASEICASDVEMPEVTFGEAVFIAKNMADVCTLDVLVETTLEGEVLLVSVKEDEASYEGQECETRMDGSVAFALSGVPEGVSLLVD